MKKQKIILIVLAILLLALTTNLIIFHISSVPPEKFIANDFLFIVQTKQTFELLQKSDYSSLFNPIIYNKTYKIYKTLTDIKIKLYNENKFFLSLINSPTLLVSYKKRHPVFIFQTGLKNKILKLYLNLLIKIKKISQSFKYKDTYQYKRFNIYHIKVLHNKRNLYFTFCRNLLLFSINKSSLQKCIDSYISHDNLKDNDRYLQVKANILDYETFRVYANTEMIYTDLKKSNINLYRSLSILNYIPLTGLSVNISGNDAQIRGFSILTNLPEKRYKKIINESINPTSTIEILPETTGQFTTLTFKNYKNAYYFFKRFLSYNRKLKKNLVNMEEKIEKYFDMPIEQFLFSWIGHQITIAKIKKYRKNVIIVKIKDHYRARRVLKKISDSTYFTDPDSITYKNYKIYQLKLPFYIWILVKIFNPKLTLPYYTIWQGYFLISENQGVIRHIINAHRNEKLLKYSSPLYKKMQTRTKDNNILIYWNKKISYIKFLKQKNILSQILKNYNAGIFTLKFTENGAIKNFFLYDHDKDKIRLIPHWPAPVKKRIIGNPIIQNINFSKRDEIIYGDTKGNINVLNIYNKSPYGWPVPIMNKLKYPPDLLYHPIERRTYIIAVSKKKELFFISYKGEKLKKLTYGRDITSKPIIKDMDNDTIPDILFLEQTNKLHCINKEGKNLPGFPIRLGKGKIKHIINPEWKDKQELLINIHNPTNRLYKIKYNNNKRLTNNYYYLAETKKDYFLLPINYKNKKQLLLLNKKGILKIINYDTGEIDAELKLKHGFTNPPTIMEIDDQFKIVLITSRGLLLILNENGSIYQKKKLPAKPIKNEKILCFDINHDYEQEIMIPLKNNYIYILNSSVKVMDKIRGSNTPCIKDIDYNGHYELLTAFKKRLLFFYQLP